MATRAASSCAPTAGLEPGRARPGPERRLRRAADGAGGARPATAAPSSTPQTRRPNRIILAAAATDRTSFGCGADDDYTYYDQCFLQQLDDGVDLARARRGDARPASRRSSAGSASAAIAAAALRRRVVATSSARRSLNLPSSRLADNSWAGLKVPRFVAVSPITATKSQVTWLGIAARRAPGYGAPAGTPRRETSRSMGRSASCGRPPGP